MIWVTLALPFTRSMDVEITDDQFFQLSGQLIDLRLKEARRFRNHGIGYLNDLLEVVFDALVVIAQTCLNRTENLAQALSNSSITFL